MSKERSNPNKLQNLKWDGETHKRQNNMDEIAKLEASLAEAKEVAEDAGGGDESLNSVVKSAEEALTKAKAQDDPLKKELEKVKGKTFTKRERLDFEKRKIDEQISKLNEEEGRKPESEEDDDKPLTIGDFKKMQKSEAKQTALTLADEIEDETERELTKHYLKERIVPSGNPQEDVNLARAAVNSLRNAEIAKEAARKTNAKGNSSAAGAPGRHDPAFEPTEQERVFMSPPYNLTKADVLKARAKSE